VRVQVRDLQREDAWDALGIPLAGLLVWVSLWLGLKPPAARKKKRANANVEVVA